jgi:hypothetical protein
MFKIFLLLSLCFNGISDTQFVRNISATETTIFDEIINARNITFLKRMNFPCFNVFDNEYGMIVNFMDYNSVVNINRIYCRIDDLYKPFNDPVLFAHDNDGKIITTSQIMIFEEGYYTSNYVYNIANQSLLNLNFLYNKVRINKNDNVICFQSFDKYILVIPKCLNNFNDIIIDDKQNDNSYYLKIPMTLSSFMIAAMGIIIYFLLFC